VRVGFQVAASDGGTGHVFAVWLPRIADRERAPDVPRQPAGLQAGDKHKGGADQAGRSQEAPRPIRAGFRKAFTCLGAGRKHLWWCSGGASGYAAATRPSRSVTVRSIRAASAGLCVAISMATL